MRRKLLGAAVALAGLALKPTLSAQTNEAPEAPAAMDEIERRLASIERVLTDRSIAEATPAAAALHQRLERFEYRLRRMEAKIAMIRR